MGLPLLIPFLMIFPADSNDVIHKTFSVEEGGTLLLDTDRGSIEVGTIPENYVKIEVIREVRRGGDESLLEDFILEFDQRGNDVEVIGKLKKPWGFKGRHIRIRFKVKVPRKYNVELKTAGGSISVEDLEGRVSTQTSGGSLHFGNITGPVEGKTSGGSITLENCRSTAFLKTSGGSITIGDVEGNVEAHTSGGSITISRARGNVLARTSGGGITVEEVMGTIDASTSGGSVEARISRQPEGNCRLKTSGGSIVVYLNDEVAVDVDAKTSAGKVETDFKVTVSGTIRKGELRGEINGGGPELYLRTSGGDIKIFRM
ncbi:MAG: DUF4097 family beta strand repeat-containing protein [Calditrichia bacterium]